MSKHSTDLLSAFGQMSKHSTDLLSAFGQMSKHSTDLLATFGQMSEYPTNIRNVFLFITYLVASIFLLAYKTIYFITSFCMVIFTLND
ncbi:hypothetical protein [Capnocytophaga catalasegens]|uniref:hypothetical protein n=1 Tax=Capnocytophaga catalasegens TaxID=1004260 RepID=UPI00222EC5BA|nr:hypothetical protein [Capnocytophaga catalasegens]